MRDIRRFHYHHADGSAVGGRLQRPVDKPIPLQASLSLPPVGGHHAIRQEKFDFEGLIHFDAASTEVSGTAIHPNGPWTTVVSTRVEGVKFADVVTADRVVARISTEHPAEGYIPKVSFVGTQFVNLRIGGQPVAPELDLDFCSHGNGSEYPRESCFHNGGFRQRVRNQRSAFARHRNTLGNTISDWVERHSSSYSDEELDRSGHATCSLVRDITGDCPGTRVGHVIDIPEFGRIYLAELIVDFDSFQLSMIRLELGCPVQGDGGVGNARINGKTGP